MNMSSRVPQHERHQRHLPTKETKEIPLQTPILGKKKGIRDAIVGLPRSTSAAMFYQSAWYGEVLASGAAHCFDGRHETGAGVKLREPRVSWTLFGAVALSSA